MEADEDMFVVIIGEDDQCNSAKNYSIVKNEDSLDLCDNKLAVQQIIENAQKHGEVINVDPKDKKIKVELKKDFDCEYLEEVKKSKNEGSNKRCTIEELRGNRSLSPSERKSFLAELKCKYPQLNYDKDALLEKIVEAMTNIKKPTLPNNYCRPKDDKFECQKCKSLSISEAAAGRHFQEKHGPRYLICFACGVDFRSTTNLYKHEKTCHAPDAILVLKARALFLGRRAKARPFLAQAKAQKPAQKSVRRFGCVECPAVFNTQRSLQAHACHHSGERPFLCPSCPMAYTSPSALTRHSKKHSDIEYICEHCARSFKDKAALVAHIHTHYPQRRHPCPECDKRFAQKAALLLHINTKHRNLPLPFACQICSKRYRRMSLLKDHMMKEHEMQLMTRKMFFKMLPNMSYAEIQQAKIVLQSDTALLNTVSGANDSVVKDENSQVGNNLPLSEQNNTERNHFDCEVKIEISVEAEDEFSTQNEEEKI